jgi:hypothetical protein
MCGLTMSRFYLRLILIPIVLFALVLLIIHTQPYDDHELRELLLPEGCPAPCFMGIRPGVTTMDEAVKILEASGWAEKIDSSFLKNYEGPILWNWTYQKPSWINEKLRSIIYIKDKKVDAIVINSKFLLGQTKLTFGLPDMDFVGSPQDPSEQQFLYEAFYPQYVVRSWLPCDATEPLRQSVEITMHELKNTIPKQVNSLRNLFHVC